MHIKSLKFSKVSYFLSLLVMIMFSSKAIANEEDLSFPFNADSGKYWQYVSDRVMDLLIFFMRSIRWPGYS